MGDAIVRLASKLDPDAVGLARVFIPPHKRTTKTGVVDVEGYWRDIGSLADLTPDERKAVGPSPTLRSLKANTPSGTNMGGTADALNRSMEKSGRTVAVTKGGRTRFVTPEEAKSPPVYGDTDPRDEAPPYSAWGKPYPTRKAAFMSPEGPIWMFRKGNRIRMLNRDGRLRGEHPSINAAVVWARERGWSD